MLLDDPHKVRPKMMERVRVLHPRHQVEASLLASLARVVARAGAAKVAEASSMVEVEAAKGLRQAKARARQSTTCRAMRVSGLS